MTHLPKKPLPGKFRDLLVDGNNNQYPDRSVAVQAVAMSMVRCGWTEEEYRTEFINKDENKLAEYFFQRKNGRVRSVTWRLRELDRTWKKATESYSSDFKDKTDVLHKVGEIKALLLDYPLSGRTKVTDSIVLGYLHDMATQRGVINPNSSLRDIAKACNVAHKTAGRSLERLTEAGWLRKDDSQGFGMANTYQVTSPSVSVRKSIKDTLDLPNECVDSVSFVDWTDVDSDHGTILTRTEINTYKAVTDTSRTAIEIHQISGSARSTVFKHLKSLVKLGLIKKDLTTYTRTEKTLESIAVDCGVQGKNAKRHKDIELGRDLFHKSEMYQRTAFNYDLKNYGMKIAKENALMREHQKIRETEGVDPVTGEILENYVESVEAVLSPSETVEAPSIQESPTSRLRALLEASRPTTVDTSESIEQKVARRLAEHIQQKKSMHIEITASKDINTSPTNRLNRYASLRAS